MPDRDLILIHAANDALKELKGCIAPVSILTSEGKGSNSRLALKKIFAIVFTEIEKGNRVTITINSKRTDNNILSQETTQNETNHIKNNGTDPELF